MGLLARLKKVFGGGRKPQQPPPRVVPVRRPPVEVAAKELRTWAPPPEIIEGPLTPLEIVMAATERAVADVAPPPPPPPAAAGPTPDPARRPVPGERIVHLVFEDGSMVPAEETSEAARMAYLGRNILDGTRAGSIRPVG
jgi:hypothetical protein